MQNTVGSDWQVKKPRWLRLFQNKICATSVITIVRLKKEIYIFIAVVGLKKGNPKTNIPKFKWYTWMGSTSKYGQIGSNQHPYVLKCPWHCSLKLWLFILSNKAKIWVLANNIQVWSIKQLDEKERRLIYWQMLWQKSIYT